jgi:hypothetical protein
VLGVMGEARKLVAAERAAVGDAAVREAGGLSVVVGATHVRALNTLLDDGTAAELDELVTLTGMSLVPTAAR